MFEKVVRFVIENEAGSGVLLTLVYCFKRKLKLWFSVEDIFKSDLEKESWSVCFT